ncbi:MAG: hypothetical protein LQ342_001956 [Letrouitia transgressa]|nr:MAG: hypothetical protein LQ342_001956 [Letrouitia transgressa]
MIYNYIAICATIACIVVVVILFIRPICNSTELDPRSYFDSQTCKSILACHGVGEEELEPGNNPLKSRALPNHRLVKVFGIDNAFTTTNESYLRHFKNLATQKFSKLGPDEWKKLAKAADILVRRGIEKNTWKDDETTRQSKIELTPFVQLISLKVALFVLFGIDPMHLEDSNVLDVARSINLLWIGSKGGYSEETFAFERKRLMAALSEIFPSIPKTRKDNPLNLILPAYETLWRVVFRCFLEIIFRSESPTPKWTKVLSKFLRKPTDQQFRRVNGNPETNPDAVSAMFIVNEALRLYPPTRRIYRQLHLAGKPKPEIFAADIEACQRDARIWGEDCYQFVPSRWRNLSVDARNSFMPFGERPFVCPAKQDFGPRLIGVLVAALVTNFSKSQWNHYLEGEHDTQFKNDEPYLPLKTDRGDYSEMMVWRQLD